MSNVALFGNETLFCRALQPYKTRQQTFHCFVGLQSTYRFVFGLFRIISFVKIEAMAEATDNRENRREGLTGISYAKIYNPFYRDLLLSEVSVSGKTHTKRSKNTWSKKRLRLAKSQAMHEARWGNVQPSTGSGNSTVTSPQVAISPAGEDPNTSLPFEESISSASQDTEQGHTPNPQGISLLSSYWNI